MANVPTHTWNCDCGETVARYRGETETSCPRCNQEFNAMGQRLRTSWRENPSVRNDEIGDLEGLRK